MAESFNGKSKPKTDQAKENNCIAQEEVKAKGDGAKKKWHKRQLSGTSTHNAAGSCGALRVATCARIVR